MDESPDHDEHFLSATGHRANKHGLVNDNHHRDLGLPTVADTVGRNMWSAGSDVYDE